MFLSRLAGTMVLPHSSLLGSQVHAIMSKLLAEMGVSPSQGCPQTAILPICLPSCQDHRHEPNFLSKGRYVLSCLSSLNKY
jgi:hypothetical protein